MSDAVGGLDSGQPVSQGGGLAPLSQGQGQGKVTDAWGRLGAAAHSSRRQG